MTENTKTNKIQMIFPNAIIKMKDMVLMFFNKWKKNFTKTQKRKSSVFLWKILWNILLWICEYFLGTALFFS